MREPTAHGYVGSDKLNEEQVDWFRETIEPVCNQAGQRLRFALIAQDGERMKRKLAYDEPLQLATSYPVTARRLLGQTATIQCVSGSIEAEVDDRADELDGAFELVQSGDSVRGNGLEVVVDDIEQVYLECIRTPYDW